MGNTEQANEPDWKKIAIELTQRVNFALSNCKAEGAGYLLDLETGKTRHWHDYMKEAIDMVPGIKIDEEVFYALRLPPVQRKKRMKEINDGRKKQAEITE